MSRGLREMCSRCGAINEEVCRGPHDGLPIFGEDVKVVSARDASMRMHPSNWKGQQ